MVVFVTWVVWQPKVFYWWTPYRDSLTARGQFGDSYGGVTSLFAGLAFAGVVVTLREQAEDRRKQDVDRQKEDRDRAAREKDRLDDRFEARFFRLTDVLRSNLQRISVVTGPSSALTIERGKTAMTVFIKEVANKGIDSHQPLQSAKSNYDKVYFSQKNLLGPYFRVLYRLLKYVNESSVNDKETYTAIVRAELGNSEVWLIALNCLTENGKKLRPLVEKYHMLKHLDDRAKVFAPVKAAIRKEYPNEAFRDPDDSDDA